MSLDPTTFDAEPEDSWDANDSTAALIRLLFRMMALLDGGPAFATRNVDPLDEVEQRLNEWRRARVLTERQVTRTVHVAYGIGYLRGREANG